MWRINQAAEICPRLPLTDVWNLPHISASNTGTEGRWIHTHRQTQSVCWGLVEYSENIWSYLKRQQSSGRITINQNTDCRVEFYYRAICPFTVVIITGEKVFSKHLCMRQQVKEWLFSLYMCTSRVVSSLKWVTAARLELKRMSFWVFGRQAGFFRFYNLICLGLLECFQYRLFFTKTGENGKKLK